MPLRPMLIDGGSGNGRNWPIKRIAFGVAALVVVLLAASQLVVPRVAENRIRSKLADAGITADVKVSTFPAARMLLGRVDSATVEVSAAQTTREKIGSLVSETRDIDRLRVAAPSMQLSGIRLTDVTLRKRGARIAASATTGRPDMVALLPPGSRLGRVRATAAGIELDGSITVLGARISGPGQLQPVGGALVFKTPALPVVGPTALTVFSDRRVEIDRVTVRPALGEFRFAAAAHLPRG